MNQNTPFKPQVFIEFIVKDSWTMRVNTVNDETKERRPVILPSNPSIEYPPVYNFNRKSNQNCNQKEIYINVMESIMETPLESRKDHYTIINGKEIVFNFYSLFCEIVKSFYLQASRKYTVRNVLVCLTIQDLFSGCYLQKAMRKNGYPNAVVKVEFMEHYDGTETIENFWYRQSIKC